MFENSTLFNQDLSGWNVGNVFSFTSMFKNAERFFSSLDEWDVSNSFNISSMFEGAKDFDANLSNWNTSSIVDMSYTFKNTGKFNHSLCSWKHNIQLLENVKEMFHSSHYSQDLSCWNETSMPNFNATADTCSNFGYPTYDSSLWPMPVRQTICENIIDGALIV